MSTESIEVTIDIKEIWQIEVEKGSHDKVYSGNFRQMYSELVAMLSPAALAKLPSPLKVYKLRHWHNGGRIVFSPHPDFLGD